MRPFRGLWVFLGGIGLLLIGAAFASGAVASETAAASDDCETVAQETGLTSSGPLQSDDACLNCHTDQERLQTLAVEEEQGESLSEGPG